MALTKDFKQTVVARVQEDAGFRCALLAEAVEIFLAGDVAVGKRVLRDYINATVGFERLANKLRKDSKRVHRMLGPAGHPRVDNIFALFKILQDEDNIALQVKVVKRKAA